MRARRRSRLAEHREYASMAAPSGGSWNPLGLSNRQDRALTAMLVLQGVLLFVVTPFAGLGAGISRILLSLLVVALAVLVILIARGRTAALVAWCAAGSVAVGAVLGVAAPFSLANVAVHSVNGIGIILCGYVVGRALFAPGPITLHRVIGAVVLYLQTGLAFAMLYRLVCDTIPDALNGIEIGPDELRRFGSILYFSLVTLTSVGYGDIIPVHPVARSLANLEAIIGHLFPATLIAALVTQHLEWRRPYTKSP